MKNSIQFASDVIRDGMGIELVDSSYNPLAELFRSDITGDFHLNTFGNEVSASDIQTMFRVAEENEGLSFRIPSSSAAVIYVELVSEAVRCFRPVLAHKLSDIHYRIDSSFLVPEDESWAFQPGDEVLCVDHEGDCLTPRATELKQQSEQGAPSNR